MSVMDELVSNGGLRGERLMLGDAFGRAERQQALKADPTVPLPGVLRKRREQAAQ